MATKKRWNRIYQDGNPLGLPQTVKREIRRASANPLESLRFLWVVLTDDDKGKREDVEKTWLNVIDEASANGAETMILSVSGPVHERPEVWTLCRWAMESHGMLVGLHLFDPTIQPEDVDQINSYEADQFCVFVCHKHVDNLRGQIESEIPIVPADGLADGDPQPKCDLPTQMTCVGQGGKMWTCGLVMGHDGYFLGDAAEVRIDKVMNDGDLPHKIPAGISDAPARCEGCPPLLEQRLRDALGQPQT